MAKQATSKTPNIRFKGFEEEWANEPLLSRIKNVIDFRGRTPKKLGMDWSPSGYLALSALNVKDGYIDPNADAHYGDEELYTKWMKGNELHCNQVLFTTEAPMGNVAQIPDAQKYILSQRTIAFVTDTERLSEDYLAVLLKSPSVFGELLARSSGGTAKGVSQKSLSSISAWVSNDLTEQTKIGEYFRELDSLICLHQRKHDKLLALKKAMLQKMFPQPGASTPEIRFKGFSGDWMQKRLGDVARFLNGRAYSQSELLEKGRYRVLRVGNFYTNSSWYYSDMDLADKFYASTGDLLYTWSASFGPHIWEGEKVIYHYHIWKVELSEALEKEFTLQLLENDKKRILDNSNGSTMVHITKEGMENKSIVIPHPDEQQKIGTYFRTLDELISKHAIQLQKLQQIKSACLEKMFV